MRHHVLASLLLLAACADDGAGADPAYEPDIDPADFVDTIDNPFLPLRPGARWVYEGTTEEGEVERVEVVVTDDRRDILGIEAVVVRDTVTVDGEVVEDTFDWFAQDVDGDVWYLGEDTREYEGGRVVSTAGSWEAGVDGAQPGIVMLGEPRVGARYRQEYLVGEAEDMARVRRVDDDRLVTVEWTPLEPGRREEKTYEAGVGLVLEEMTVGGDDRLELVEFDPGQRGFSEGGS